MGSRSNAAKVANRAEAISHPNVLKKEGWVFAFLR
jgi:hypothetical protein